LLQSLTEIDQCVVAIQSTSVLQTACPSENTRDGVG
jgi:hypothetical protein